jgi:hypothetical protein
MRRFFQTWRFRHPSTADFEHIILEASSGELGWFLEQALHSDRALDYRVRSATSSKDRGSRGWFRDDEGEMTLLGEIDRPHADEHADASGHDEPAGDLERVKDGDDPDTEDALYRSVVVVDRVGEFVHPVTVELVFADGETLRREWDGRDRWLRIVEERPAKLVSVEVDPERLMVLDVDPLNNSRRLEPDRRPAAKILVHMMFWLQNLFELTSIVG